VAFQSDQDVVTYDWNVPTRNPSNPSIGCNAFEMRREIWSIYSTTHAQIFIEVIEHLANLATHSGKQSPVPFLLTICAIQI
jgi:hypothetical protein